jgi:hypothetical protein
MKAHFSIARVLALLLCLLPLVIFSQKTNDFLDNPSFESEPKRGSYYNKVMDSKFIYSWFDCGFIEFPFESKPDIHSAESGFWSVKHAPSEGNTFLGMTVRDNGSWESITQEFKEPLKEGYCYKFTIDLSKAANYVSSPRLSEENNNNYNYEGSAILNIWAGEYLCDKSRLIYKSPTIDHEEWKSYEVYFQSKLNTNCLILQAYFTDETNPYNGHVLVDNISNFSITACEE